MVSLISAFKNILYRSITNHPEIVFSDPSHLVGGSSSKDPIESRDLAHQDVLIMYQSCAIR
jgi:hypothetical protein